MNSLERVNLYFDNFINCSPDYIDHSVYTLEAETIKAVEKAVLKKMSHQVQ